MPAELAIIGVAVAFAVTIVVAANAASSVTRAPMKGAFALLVVAILLIALVVCLGLRRM